MEIVQLASGQRALKASTHSQIIIPLPKVLPEKFTIELGVINRNSNAIGANTFDLAGGRVANDSKYTMVGWGHNGLSVSGGALDHAMGTPRDEHYMGQPLINEFEARQAAVGTEVVKVMLHISNDEQKERLLARLDNPAKHWKYSTEDLKQRAFWDDYMAAYQAAFDATSRNMRPWYVVPANKKWYARIAVQQLLLEALGTRTGVAQGRVRRGSRAPARGTVLN